MLLKDGLNLDNIGMRTDKWRKDCMFPNFYPNLGSSPEVQTKDRTLFSLKGCLSLKLLPWLHLSFRIEEIL